VTNKYKANKGEWSEPYTFLKLISDEKIKLCDKNLNSINKEFNVLKVSNMNIHKELNIPIDKGKITQNDIDKLREEILNGEKNFEIEFAENLFKEINVDLGKGGNAKQKSDILISLSNESFKNELVGFSIKSFLGKVPTLLNASKKTNFIYEILDFNEKDLKEINNLNTKDKIRKRLETIKDKGYTINFVKVEDETFQHNLNKVSLDMDEILSSCLLNSYLEVDSKKRISNLYKIFKKDKNDDDSYFDIENNKIKRLLISSMLGFFPGSIWNGDFAAKGSIIVKDDGSLVMFHIKENLEDLKNFLFENIKFDTPSTSRYKQGLIYKSANNSYYIKLNLQLRFIQRKISSSRR